MAKRCTRCGNFLMDDERFCTRCGENVSNVMPEGMSAASVNAQPAGDGSFGRNEGYISPYGQNTQQQFGQAAPGYGQQPPYTYAQPTYKPADDEMSLGKWVGTIIVTTFFSLISLIFLFIWAFGDGPECRKKYCKAMLIVDAISLVIGLVIYGIFFSIIAGSFSGYMEKYNELYSEYGQTAAVFLSSLIG